MCAEPDGTGPRVRHGRGARPGQRHQLHHLLHRVALPALGQPAPDGGRQDHEHVRRARCPSSRSACSRANRPTSGSARGGPIRVRSQPPAHPGGGAAPRRGRGRAPARDLGPALSAARHDRRAVSVLRHHDLGARRSRRPHRRCIRRRARSAWPSSSWPFSACSGSGRTAYAYPWSALCALLGAEWVFELHRFHVLF